LCQIYSNVHHLGPDAETPFGDEIVVSFESLASAAARGLPPPVTPVDDSSAAVFKRGHAWCARRDLLAKHGLYDRGVIGIGDRLLAHAVTGQTEDLIRHLGLGESFAEHYRTWAAGFTWDARSIGCVEGDILHLWHGDLARRRYTGRFELHCGIMASTRRRTSASPIRAAGVELQQTGDAPRRSRLFSCHARRTARSGRTAPSALQALSSGPSRSDTAAAEGG
jgi:hypothetical protein